MPTNSFIRAHGSCRQDRRTWLLAFPERHAHGKRPLAMFFLRSRPLRAERITLVIASLAGGGSERVAVDLVRFLQESGRKVTVITLNGDDPDDYPVPHGVHRERLEIRKDAASVLDTVRLTCSHLAAMRKRIVSTKPDVVVSFIDITNTRTIASLLGTGVPRIAAERTDPEHHQLSKRWQVARNWIYPWADAVLV